MPAKDGDGWVDCSCGQRHWGLNGAAGVVIVHALRREVLLQLRAPWTHGGQTWGFPGGARDSHETVVQAALRELHEELGVAPHTVTVLHDHTYTDHGDWSYHTVIAQAREDLEITHNDESIEVRWVSVAEVDSYELHPGVRSSWNDVARQITQLLADD